MTSHPTPATAPVSPRLFVLELPTRGVGRGRLIAEPSLAGLRLAMHVEGWPGDVGHVWPYQPDRAFDAATYDRASAPLRLHRLAGGGLHEEGALPA